jgi:hypothetical protein
VEDFGRAARAQIEECVRFCERTSGPPEHGSDPTTPAEVVARVQDRMSRCAAHVRDASAVRRAVESARRLWERLPSELRVRDARALKTAFWAADLCLAHWVWLESIKAYLDAGGSSRGSVLILDGNGTLPAPGLEDEWRFAAADPASRVDKEILEVRLTGGDEVSFEWVPVRPVPSEDGWFEDVWREYREGRVIVQGGTGQ